MYKTFILFFFFFPLLAIGQNTPLPMNHKNTEEVEEKEDVKIQADGLSSNSQALQIKMFQSNVMSIESDLNEISFSSSRKSPTKLELQEMESHLEMLKAINAESFEYNLLNYQVGNYDFSRIESLKTAERLQPNNPVVLKELSAYSYINKNEIELKKYLNKLSAQQVFSKDLQVYADNILQSLPKNSILITHGEKDTYPLLIQQKVKNTRRDVEIISLAHLQSEDYRKSLVKSGLIFPNNNFIDTRFFEEFMQLNKSKSIVVSATVPRSYLVKVGGDVKANGLGVVFFSPNSSLDTSNRKLYENTMKSLIEQHVKESKEKQLLGNYLPFLFSVRNSYIEKNEVKRIAEIEVLILKVGQLSNKYTQVKSLLNK